MVNTAKHSGFYTTFAPEALGPKKRRTNYELNSQTFEGHGPY